MIIRFSDDFTKYTNGLSEISVECEKLGEGLLYTFELFPQLYVHLMDNQCAVATKSSFQFNGDHIWEYGESERTVCDVDVLYLERGVPNGEDGDTFKMIINVGNILAGIVMIVASSFYPVMWGWGHFLGISIMMDGIQGLSGGGLSMSLLTLMGVSTGEWVSPNQGLNQSAAYTFDGVRNTTASGTPLQLVYGRHRIGGHVLNIYTEAENYQIINFKNETVDVFGNILYAQIGVCEGEITGLKEVEVNQLPLSYYNEVYTVPDEKYFRLGTRNQDVMPLFTRVENTNSINRLVTKPKVGITPATLTESATLSPVYGAVNTSKELKVGSFVWVDLEPPL